MASSYTRNAVQEQANYSGATEKQISFILSLIDQVYDEPERTTYRGSVTHSQLSKQRASTMISNLIAQRDELKAKRAAQQAIPAAKAEMSPLVQALHGLNGGYYALRDEDRVRFFKVDLPSEGKWQGWVFIKEQAGDELYPVAKLAPAHTEYSGKYQALMQALVDDEHAAYALYGHEIGRCGVCGRTLTDELSRERGIGPVCWDHIHGGL